MKSELIERLINLGKLLDFDVRTEVEASESAWVDIVWFDKRLPVGDRIGNMRYAPVLPVVAFEVELHTGLNAKHVKGSVSNLSNLNAELSVIVIGKGNLTDLQSQKAHKDDPPEKLKQILCDRVYRWVYAEGQPRGRVIVMFEDEVGRWDDRMQEIKSSADAPKLQS
ncbi:MAG: hypothetical protein WA419_00640 [Silvibacterium sp.]